MIFWILVAVLVAVAIFWLAPALLREHRLVELDRKQQNVSIAKERLDEIAADHASGAMTDEVFEQARTELEASLIDDVEQQDEASVEQPVSSGKSAKFTWIILAVLIPLSTLGLYYELGSPQYLELAGGNAGRTANVAAHGSETPATMGELITRLKQRLEENPDDGDGWYLLSRTYMAESRYAEALEALNKTYEIYGDHPAILVGMADAEAMTRGGDLTGKPTEHLEKALELEPENTTALWLGGMSAQQNGKFQLAVDRWSKLIPQLHSDQQSLQEVNSLIQQAVAEAKASGIEVVVSEAQMAPPAPVVAAMSETERAMEQLPEINAPPVIKAWVSIDKAMAEKASATDTVFVFAKAKQGPPMPLAAFKTTVGELPLEVTLDDSMAMMPQMKLSMFDEVVVNARVSKSGQPTASAGDLTSAMESVQLGGVVGVELTISEVVQ